MWLPGMNMVPLSNADFDTRWLRKTGKWQKSPTLGGRKFRLMGMAEDKSHQDIALAIDIGGTKAAFSIIGINGDLLIPIEKHLVPFTSENKADPVGILE